MVNEAVDRGQSYRPFSRVVGDWQSLTRQGGPPERRAGRSAVPASSRPRAEPAGGRRWAPLCIAAYLLWVAATATAAFTLHSKLSRLEKQGEALAAQLMQRDAEVRGHLLADRQTQAALQREAGEREAASALLAAARTQTESLQARLEEASRKLLDAEEREAQARARWAYAEGERDAFYQQLLELLAGKRDAAGEVVDSGDSTDSAGEMSIEPR